MPLILNEHKKVKRTIKLMVLFTICMCVWGFYQDYLFLDPFVHLKGRTEISSETPSCSPYLLSKEAKNIMQDESTLATMQGHICRIVSSKLTAHCEISEDVLSELKTKSHMYTEEKEDAGSLGNAKFKVYSLLEKKADSQVHYFYGLKENALHAVKCYGEYQLVNQDYVVPTLKTLTKSIVPFL